MCPRGVPQGWLHPRPQSTRAAGGMQSPCTLFSAGSEACAPPRSQHAPALACGRAGPHTPMRLSPLASTAKETAAKAAAAPSAAPSLPTARRGAGKAGTQSHTQGSFTPSSPCTAPLPAEGSSLEAAAVAFRQRTICALKAACPACAQRTSEAQCCACRHAPKHAIERVLLAAHALRSALHHTRTAVVSDVCEGRAQQPWGLLLSTAARPPSTAQHPPHAGWAGRQAAAAATATAAAAAAAAIHC